VFVKVIENNHQLSNEFTDILEQWVQTPGRTQQPLPVVSYQLPPEGQRHIECIDLSVYMPLC